ncbi:winged helix-turn-helix domain-containing protein [Roseateles violae]|uniref:Winged helix-turn-helix domain-containing protein n=1 Tax=Roseateles violae TaxID=3058042 RepID=A0ABT8DL45_9BURK|nr:winged helix-turn-helix domain-containing protein [Pelomonas sp. PFR6]MDN3919136.1 winged helix-turn-helix domain-containing protein [Pelomonas sp. PFR6]
MNDRSALSQSWPSRQGGLNLAQEPDFRLGTLKIQPSTLQVEHDTGLRRSLERRVMQVLVVLVHSEGRVVSRDELIERCWAGRVVGDNAINRVISRIRLLAAAIGGTGFEIETIPRVGYRLKRVEPGQPPTGSKLEESSNETGGGPSRGPERRLGARRASAPSSAARRLWLAAPIAAGTVAALAGAGWWFGRREPVVAEAARGVTLAVLPFKPLAEQEREKLLELGMADSLIMRLSRVPGLVVRSTGSTLRYAGPQQDTMRAARELDVDWIVDGSLMRDGAQLRATARLLRSADGVAVWSGSFDEKINNIFDVQDQISQRLMQALAPLIQSAVQAAPATAAPGGGTRNAEAYQLYLAAMWRAQGQRLADIERALQLLDQALSLDPGYALAWTGLAWTHRRGLWIDARPSAVFEPANRALKNALALAPDLAETRAGIGFSLYWFDFHWSAAEREFRAALRSNPNSAIAHFGLAQLLLTQDRIDEGLAHMRQTRELDPMSAVFNTLEASFLLDAGRLAEAGRRLDRALEFGPQLWLTHLTLGLLRIASGQDDQGLAALRRAVELGGDISRPKAVLGVRLAGIGQREEARALLDGLLQQAQSRYVPPTSLAALHAALGQELPALDALERAWLERDTRLIYLKDDPHWRSLQQQPRFRALKAKLRLDGFGRGLSPV